MPSTSFVVEFKIFRKKCIELRNLVNCFHLLFESEESKNDLKSFASIFFDDLHGWMTELYLIYAARLLDPATQGNYGNLTVEHIKNGCCREGLLTDSISAIASQLIGYRNLIQMARHKVVAHIDLETASSKDLFGTHSEQEYSQFLKNLQLFCDEVGEVLGEGPLDFSYQPDEGDVTDLILKIHKYSGQSRV